MGLSPGLDFETKLYAKPDAAKLLERELAKPGYKVRPIAIGTNTDPYQPIEKEWRIMRQVLEVLKACDHPVMIVTKSAMVMRDIDLLAPMAEKGLAKVGLSVTTLDRKLARLMEPRASTPAKRARSNQGAVGGGYPFHDHGRAGHSSAQRPRDRAGAGFGEVSRRYCMRATFSCAFRSR